MLAGLDPSGLYITIENNSDKDIKDLIYLVDDEVDKVKTIKKGDEAKIYIFTANFLEEKDLTFYFESNPNKKFTFPKKIQVTNPQKLWIYDHYSISSQDNHLIIQEKKHS